MSLFFGYKDIFSLSLKIFKKNTYICPIFAYFWKRENVANMDSTSDLIYKQFKDVEKDDFQYIYRGDVTPKLIMNVLDFAKSNLAKAEDTKKLNLNEPKNKKHISLH